MALIFKKNPNNKKGLKNITKNEDGLQLNFSVSFREAHGIAGKVVAKGEELNVSINKIPIEIFSQISPAFGDGKDICSGTWTKFYMFYNVCFQMLVTFLR